MFYYAQNAQTGNATTQSIVETNIQGDGSVSTHIEVEANGEKKVLNANSAGNYKLDIESNNNSATVSASSSTSSTFSKKPNANEKPKIKTTLFINLKAYLENILEIVFKDL